MPDIITLLNASKVIDANIAEEAGKFATVEDGQEITLDEAAGIVTLDVEGGEIVGAALA